MINKFKDYFFLILSILLICIFIFKPWEHSLLLPYSYWSDSYFTQMLIKNIIATGKFWYSNQLSLPGDLNLLDFPSAQYSLYGLVYFFSLFSKDHFLIFNIFFISSFFLSGLSSFYVLRHLKFNKKYSYLSALVFAFLPYHFAHGSIHVFLSHYFIVPFSFLVSYWILFSTKTKYKLWGTLAIGLLVGTTGIYYAYFSCILIAFSTFISLIQKRINKNNLQISIIFSVTVITIVLMQLVPNFKFWSEYGRNNGTGHRDPTEAVLHGLKIRELFIPLHDYNISFLKPFTREYKADPGQDLENKQYLGIIGIFGVIICSLIFFNINIFSKSLKRKEKDKYDQEIKNWYYIFALLVLVSMSYGGASMIAKLITPQIRAYGRIVPFLNFSLILILLSFLESWKKQINKSNFLSFVIIFIFIFSIFDGTKAYNPIKLNLVNDFYSDQQFIEKIENNLESNSSIYQLPYKQFPETPNLHKIGSYELMKGYLHSTDLKWSYGSMYGRHVAGWQSNLSLLEPLEQLQILKKRDFKRLYIDTYGYEDGGISSVASFSAILNIEPLISNDGRLILFDLTSF